MISIPLPFVSAGILLFLALRLWIKERHRGGFLIVLLLCAGQTIILSLAHHYQVEWARLVMPITACVVPFSMLYAFEGLRGGASTRFWMISIACVGAAALMRGVFPTALDGWIPLVYIGVATVILWHGRLDEAFSQGNLGASDQLRQFWTWIAGLLYLSAVFDIVIYGVIGSFGVQGQMIAISVFSSIMVFALGAFVFVSEGNFVPFVARAEPPQAGGDDKDILIRIEALMRETQLFLDPELSIMRIARKLNVPVRSVSDAINRMAGENVSRYVNRWRIDYAQNLLRGGRSVTEVIYHSGFNTKSNFNREFSRVAGMSPSEWLKNEAQARE